MFKKQPIINYESAIDYKEHSLLPARNFVPDWYKKIPKSKNKNGVLFDGGFRPTLKLCVPFLDAFTSGYMITTPYDIYIKNIDGAPFLVGPQAMPEKELPRWRKEIAHENLVPSGCYPYEYTWNYCIAYTVPVGYSMLATHPFNRWDLPFVTLTGIVDGGVVMQHDGNFPFYIKEGFEGIIPQGTPIVQLIPFRQEKWKSEKQIGLVKEGQKHAMASAAKITGWYKNTFWTKKEYN
jgi:hypothetical protein